MCMGLWAAYAAQQAFFTPDALLKATRWKQIERAGYWRFVWQIPIVQPFFISFHAIISLTAPSFGQRGFGCGTPLPPHAQNLEALAIQSLVNEVWHKKSRTWREQGSAIRINTRSILAPFQAKFSLRSNPLTSSSAEWLLVMRSRSMVAFSNLSA